MSSTTQERTGADTTDSGEFIQRRYEGASGIEADLWDAIDGIPDPHIPVSLVEMGMIYDVTETEGRVDVEMTFPCMGCPAYDMIRNDIRSCLLTFPSVDSVDISVVWEPVWSKDMLSQDVRRELRDSGISL